MTLKSLFLTDVQKKKKHRNTFVTDIFENMKRRNWVFWLSFSNSGLDYVGFPRYNISMYHSR